MAYFEDGSPYEYGRGASPPLQNVGWLEGDHPFPVGTVPDEFIDRVIELAQAPVNRFRGYHICTICPPEGDVPVTPTGFRLESPACFTVRHAGTEVEIVANGEVRVAGPDGTRWAAPAMIAHYVVAHRYRPPQGFIDAVLEGTVLPDPQRRRRARPG